MGDMECARLLMYGIQPEVKTGDMEFARQTHVWQSTWKVEGSRGIYMFTHVWQLTGWSKIRRFEKRSHGQRVDASYFKS